jgi:hypothetical protein
MPLDVLGQLREQWKPLLIQEGLIDPSDDQERRAVRSMA